MHSLGWCLSSQWHSKLHAPFNWLSKPTISDTSWQLSGKQMQQPHCPVLAGSEADMAAPSFKAAAAALGLLWQGNPCSRPFSGPLVQWWVAPIGWPRGWGCSGGHALAGGRGFSRRSCSCCPPCVALQPKPHTDRPLQLAACRAPAPKAAFSNFTPASQLHLACPARPLQTHVLPVLPANSCTLRGPHPGLQVTEASMNESRESAQAAMGAAEGKAASAGSTDVGQGRQAAQVRALPAVSNRLVNSFSRIPPMAAAACVRAE